MTPSTTENAKHDVSATSWQAGGSRRRLRVCMLSYSFYENDTRIQQYVNALAARGDEVDVISLRRPGGEVHGQVGSAELWRIQERAVDEGGALTHLWLLIKFLFRSFVRITRLHRKKRYDVIHVHSVPDFLVFAALLPKWNGAVVLLDIHDVLPELYSSKFGCSSRSLTYKALLLAERLSVRFADFVLVANEIWRTRIGERCHASGKCLAIENYPDPKLFRLVPRPAGSRPFTILYPGSLNHHQGLDIAIRAFSRVSGKMPNAIFDIYGEGPAKPALRLLIDELGLHEQVRLHDFLPVSDIANIMATADLAVVPKRASDQFGTEAASTKILEFMSVGVPVIVSRTTIDSLQFSDHQVMFFTSENEAELSECMLRFYSTPSLCLEFRNRGIKYAEEHNWKTRQVDYLDNVDRLVGRKDARA